MDWRIRRTAQVIVTVFSVISLSFVLIRLIPGGPINFLVVQMERQGVPPDEIYSRAEQLYGINPDDPLHIAYFDYMGQILSGNLGTSTWFGDPVADLMAEAIPWTVFVLSWATFIGFALGISLGAIMAYYEGGKLDVGLTAYAMVMGSIPYYVFAILLLLVVAYQNTWFPTGGHHPTGVTAGFNWPYIKGIIHHATLPVLSLVLSGSIASLTMRGNSIRVLGNDYVRVARLRGLSDGTIALQYVARNAILPMYTGLMISIGTMFGGAVILETIFGYHGMGWYLVRAVNARDYPLMMGAFMVITIVVVLALLIADLTYGKLDPRIGGEGREQF